MGGHFCHNTYHRTVGTASGGTGRQNVAVGSVWQHISVVSKLCVQATEHFHTITQKDIADNFTWKFFYLVINFFYKGLQKLTDP